MPGKDNEMHQFVVSGKIERKDSGPRKLFKLLGKTRFHLRHGKFVDNIPREIAQMPILNHISRSHHVLTSVVSEAEVAKKRIKALAAFGKETKPMAKKGAGRKNNVVYSPAAILCHGARGDFVA